MLISNVALLAMWGGALNSPSLAKGQGPLALPSAEASEVTAQHLSGFQKHRL